MEKSIKKCTYLEGLKDGLPIGLGYFAVSFSLGIIAKKAGLNPVQGFIASVLNHASAGEYALFTSIQQSVRYVEIILLTLSSFEVFFFKIVSIKVFLSRLI